MRVELSKVPPLRLSLFYCSSGACLNITLCCSNVSSAPAQRPYVSSPGAGRPYSRCKPGVHAWPESREHLHSLHQASHYPIPTHPRLDPGLGPQLDLGLTLNLRGLQNWCPFRNGKSHSGMGDLTSQDVHPKLGAPPHTPGGPLPGLTDTHRRSRAHGWLSLGGLGLRPAHRLYTPPTT